MKDIRLIHGPESRWRRRALQEIDAMVDHREGVAAGPNEYAKASSAVLVELPVGLVEGVMPWGVREAWGYVEGVFLCLHYCQECQGWIVGEADEVKVLASSLERAVNGPVDGGAQAGMSYRCRRCGSEIAFLAAV